MLFYFIYTTGQLQQFNLTPPTLLMLVFVHQHNLPFFLEHGPSKTLSKPLVLINLATSACLLLIKEMPSTTMS
jgi:hypothetical protein